MWCVTSGGTGITPTDRTPDVTRALLDYEIPGIAEAIRAYSRDRVPTSALSRGLAGVAGRTLIVNLPGSMGGARDGAGRARPDPGPRGGPAARRRPPGCRLDVGARRVTQLDGARTRPPVSRPPTARALGRGPGRLPRRRLRAAAPEPVEVPLAAADGHTLAAALTTLTALPAFPTSSVDGYAARGPGPWRVVGRVLAGAVPDPIDLDTAIEIATGAMVPVGTEHIVRVEDADSTDGPGHRRVPALPDWRDLGDEAARRRGAAAGRHTGHPGRGRPRRRLRLRHARGAPAAARRAWSSSATSCSPPGRPGRAGFATRSGPSCRVGCAGSARHRSPAPTRAARWRTPWTPTSTR